MKRITVSTDKSKLDVPFIQHFLKDIYWAAGRTIAEVQTTIAHSFCFGIYLGDKQIGFARVITDYVVFAYVMDVFITEEYREIFYPEHEQTNRVFLLRKK